MDNVVSIKDYLLKKKKMLLAFKYESVSERVDRINHSVDAFNRLMNEIKKDNPADFYVES